MAVQSISSLSKSQVTGLKKAGKWFPFGGKNYPTAQARSNAQRASGSSGGQVPRGVRAAKPATSKALVATYKQTQKLGGICIEATEGDWWTYAPGEVRWVSSDMKLVGATVCIHTGLLSDAAKGRWVVAWVHGLPTETNNKTVTPKKVTSSMLARMPGYAIVSGIVQDKKVVTATLPPMPILVDEDGSSSAWRLYVRHEAIMNQSDQALADDDDFVSFEVRFSFTGRSERNTQSYTL